MKLVYGQFEFLEISRARSSVAKNSYLKGGFGHDRLMKRRIAINSRDEVSFGESVFLLDDRLIADEESRCDFISSRRCVAFNRPLDLYPTIVRCRGVH